MKKRTTRIRLAESGEILGSTAARKGRTDWPRVDALSDNDIARAASTDKDTRLLTTRDLEEAYRVPRGVDVRGLRRRLRMSQGAFARKYGFSVDSLQDWEQGRVGPSRAARVLLTVIAREPEAVDRALHNMPTKWLRVALKRGPQAARRRASGRRK